jgi:hypothetical protein
MIEKLAKKAFLLFIAVIYLLALTENNQTAYASLAIPSLNYPIAPDPDSLICYMQITDGYVLNLERICGNSSLEPRQMLSSRDRQFIEEYEGFVQNLSVDQSNLLQTSATNPVELIRRAADVCNVLRTGNPHPQVPTADQEILVRLAAEYYCQEFDD